jgi:hypothetical protein
VRVSFVRVNHTACESRRKTLQIFFVRMWQDARAINPKGESP